jgi:hypothetical protein
LRNPGSRLVEINPRSPRCHHLCWPQPSHRGSLIPRLVHTETL